MINFIYRYMRKNISLLWIGFLSTIIAALAEIMYPFFIQEIVNVLLHSKTVLELSFTTLLVLISIVSIIIIIMHVIIILTEQKLTSDLGHDLRKDIYASILRYPWHKIRRFHTGNLSFRIKNDTFLIGERIRTLYSDVIYDILSVIGPFIAMLYINAKLAIFIATSIIISTFIINPIIKKAELYERALQIYNAKFSGHIQESLSWIKTVKLHQAESFELQRISDLNIKVKNIDRAAGITMSLAIPLGYVSQFSSTLVVLGYGGNLLMDNVINPGNFVAVFVWEQLMADSIKRLGKYASIIYSLRSLIHRVTDLLPSTDEAGIDHNAEMVSTASHSDDLLKLHIPAYSLPGGGILFKDIVWCIKPGERIMLTGENGAGKSTLLDILLGLQPVPSNAKILLRGHTITQWTESRWAHHFSLMNQHTQLIKGSLRDNLCIADNTANDEKLRIALINAGGESLLKRYKNDLSAGIDEKGTSLSGGERQIISLARVILKNAPIVFFDEPTTYLDQDNVNRFIHLIENMDKEKTIVIISHDPRLHQLTNQTVKIAQKTLHKI